MPLFTYLLGLGWSWVRQFVGFITVFVCFLNQQNLVYVANTIIGVPVQYFLLEPLEGHRPERWEAREETVGDDAHAPPAADENKLIFKHVHTARIQRIERICYLP